MCEISLIQNKDSQQWARLISWLNLFLQNNHVFLMNLFLEWQKVIIHVKNRYENSQFRLYNISHKLIYHISISISTTEKFPCAACLK